MKKILISTLTFTSLLFGEIVLNKNIEQFELFNQFDKKQSIKQDTKKIIFAFKKASGHIVKDFLASKEAEYLSKRDALFVADVSAMPSVIRWFVLDDLDKYNYSIILIEDDEISDKYKDEKNIEKILVVSLDNLKVIKIEHFDNVEDLESSLN
ncbi:MAG: hypothetical protein U9Q20_03930 [Campylobacterota bacterium]|nr:hypothetical protein [Campylobacterota bacterium]